MKESLEGHILILPLSARGEETTEVGRDCVIGLGQSGPTVDREGRLQSF